MSVRPSRLSYRRTAARLTHTQSHAPTPAHPHAHAIRRKHLPTKMQVNTHTHAHARTHARTRTREYHRIGGTNTRKGVRAVTLTRTRPTAHVQLSSRALPTRTVGATWAGSMRSSTMPARRRERNAVAKLHRNGHDLLQRRATCCNTGCAAPSCNVERQRRAPTKLLNIGGCTLQPSSSQRAWRTNTVARTLSAHATRKSRCDMLITATRLLQHRCATNTDILLHTQCDIVCCLALQRSTPRCNVTVTLGATCCNAHMKFAPTGLLVPIVTPSQMIVTASATAAHTASLKSHHGRVPPAIGTPMLCSTRFLKGVLNGAYSRA